MNRKKRLGELFRDKHESVINYPDWLLSADNIEGVRRMSKPAIAEIAGRDSVAAAITAVEKERFTDLIPTYVYTGTEYGPWLDLEQAVHRLKVRLPNVQIHDLVILGSPKFWRALNGRYVSHLISRFGFYTPCVGCHVYLHGARIPMASTLGNIPIIARERESHNGFIKINQIAEALNGYKKLAETFGIELMMPLRRISSGRLIEDILGFDWKQGEEQLGCSLSGNYRFAGGNIKITASQIQRFLEEFAMPCAEQIVNVYIEGRIPNHLDIAGRQLKPHRI